MSYAHPIENVRTEPAWAACDNAVQHDVEFGAFLSEHDGHRVAVTFERYGVEISETGRLHLNLDATYRIGDRLIDVAAPRGADAYEGFPIRWAALTEATA
jgi:hypothetical protein